MMTDHKEIDEFLSNLRICRICCFEGFSWDPSDLIACKNMVFTMLLHGVKPKVIKTLDFGNLDIDSVISEFYN